MPSEAGWRDIVETTLRNQDAKGFKYRDGVIEAAAKAAVDTERFYTKQDRRKMIQCAINVVENTFNTYRIRDGA